MALATSRPCRASTPKVLDGSLGTMQPRNWLGCRYNRTASQSTSRASISVRGALYTEGWDRQVRLTREAGKAMKREINTTWIYPPAADRNTAFAVANPD